MTRKLIASLFLLFLAACSPAQPVFYYIKIANGISLNLARQPGPDQPLGQVPLSLPAGCGFWSLNPGPGSSRFAVELACPFGTVTYLLDGATGKFRALIDDPQLDYRFLAWHPNGGSIYLKAGTLSSPRITRLDFVTGWQRDLPISPFVYDLDVSPDGKSLLFSLTPGLGLGSETWVSDENGGKAQKLWSDPQNIFGPARFSPDGKWIAFILSPDSTDMNPAGQLWQMDVRGGNARLIGAADAGRGFAPLWSPDGAWIAFVGPKKAGEAESSFLSFYNMKTGLVTVTDAIVADAPAWKFDSAGVYFTAAGNDTMNVMFYDLSASRADLLLSGACCAGWIH